jgi:Ca2+-binding RTX toxin-like protein
MFLFDTWKGDLISTYMSPMPWETQYCSAHLGNFVPAADKKLLPFGWYMGGATVIDFTNPANPTTAAYYDAAGSGGPAGPNGSDNWTIYWYEGPALPGSSLTLYGTDGVHDPVSSDTGARGFQVFRADVAANEVNMAYLNPQTQEQMVPAIKCKGKIATLVGSALKDNIIGTSGKDVIAALGGNDRVNGKKGNDLICGAKGKDRLRGAGGKDRLYGQGDNDRLNGGPARDLCHGGPGRDRARACEKQRSIP